MIIMKSEMPFILSVRTGIEFAIAYLVSAAARFVRMVAHSSCERIALRWFAVCCLEAGRLPCSQCCCS